MGLADSLMHLYAIAQQTTKKLLTVK